MRFVPRRIHMPYPHGPISFMAYGVVGMLLMMWLMCAWTVLGCYYLFKYTLWVPMVWLWQSLRWGTPLAYRGVLQLVMFRHQVTK